MARPSRDLLITAHQQVSREWWETCRGQFECFVSQAVIDEAEAGDEAEAAKRMAIVDTLPVLEITEETRLLTGVIMRTNLFPAQAVRDAVHIAVCATNHVDYLLTWNCRHLANAQIIRRLSTLVSESGYNIPVICTPEELFGAR